MYATDHRLKNFGCARTRVYLLGGLLVGALTAVGFAEQPRAATASGVATSQFELAPPSRGGPPRPPQPPEMPADWPGPAVAGGGGQGGTSLPKSPRAARDPIASGTREQELSIEPGSQPLLPDDAPAWIGALPETSGEVHRLPVGGQIAGTASEASGLLDDALVAAVTRYVDQTVLQRSGAGDLKDKLTADYIWKNLIDDPQGYVARLNTSGMPMFQKWVTVSITPQQRDIIRAWDREATQRKRLVPVGTGMLGLLGSVGLLHLIFKGRKPRT